MKSWVKELPVKRFLFGIGNKEIDLDRLKEALSSIIQKDMIVEYIDQTEIKTLGKCLAELMKLVETEWFVYLHTDVSLTEHCWLLIKSFVNDKIGIIESERYHWDGSYIDLNNNQPKYTNESYFSRPRAFSGFQLIKKKAIESILDKIEDDYMYRNEDLIFQNFCKNNGFEYKKVLAMHIHQIINPTWSINRKRTFHMQWKGLIKYARPDSITLDACVTAFQINVKENGYNPIRILEYAKETNIEWYNVLKDYYLIEIIKKKL